MEGAGRGAGGGHRHDRGPTVSLALRNDGDLGLLPAIGLSLSVIDGSAAPQPMAVPQAVRWSGATTTVATDVAKRLLSGKYVLAIRIDYAMPTPDGQTVLPPVEQQVPFRVGGLDDGAIPLCPPA